MTCSVWPCPGSGVSALTTLLSFLCLHSCCASAQITLPLLYTSSNCLWAQTHLTDLTTALPPPFKSFLVLHTLWGGLTTFSSGPFSITPVTLYCTYPFTNSIHQQAPAVLLLTPVLNYPPLFISFTTIQLNPWHHLWSCWSQYSPNSPLTFHPAPSTLFQPILHAASRVIISKCLRISNLL